MCSRLNLLKVDKQCRVNTFVNWPHDYPLLPDILAHHGFFYCLNVHCSDDEEDDYNSNDENVNDKIRCAGCPLEFCNFAPNTFINRAHERLNCIFAKVRSEEYDFYNGLSASIPSSVARVCDAAADNGDDIDSERIDVAIRVTRCGVCLLSKNRYVCLAPCGHLVCESCVFKLNTCPYCRQTFFMFIRIYF
ncbi:IAP-1 [Euproctis pseudoconspersa nucleopolyhedrovirus]|uniref:IAP-1 n=1 Tax=Euproctis pseudoconspersa nucleopolyhedrovirus TaxID=307467 RepID=C3TWV0_9ABAC|nr:IAP-1 [Euproctis pseudoconspersa nucleopolyhedrovirus]ACO53492.1 IAP-1 [Euproctis pseudoconspersa nucleopolyhedrovirus]QUJ09231.1 IAP-1 protein [Gynaephora ruoergensis nucleopolyhedrovirus]